MDEAQKPDIWVLEFSLSLSGVYPYIEWLSHLYQLLHV